MSFKQMLPAILTFSAFLGAGPNVEAARPEVPAGHAMYIVMLHDVTTMPHPADRPRPNGRKKPDMERIGGRVVEDLGDSLVITLPEAGIERVKNDPVVRSVQRVWLGERIDSKPKMASLRQETLATETESGGKVTWSSGSYAYDPSGNIKTIGNDSYGYDSAGRLIKTVLNGKTETYGYDAYGNLISKTTDNLNRPFPAVDAGTNRLSGYVYDVAGNLTDFGAAKYQFDALNMITVLGSASSVKQRFIYTPDDERIGIVSLPDGFARWRIRDFQNRVIREFTGRPDNVWRWDEDYVYAEGRIVAGERFATQGVFTQYHTDHLGSVRLITNQNGSRIVSKEYYPFGEEQTPVKDELTYYNHQRASPMKFTGHERDYLWTLDDKSEYLDYMHARQYNPIFGRFLSVDPTWESADLSRPQSWNRYAYVMNNPINLTDPDGKCPFCVQVLWELATDFVTDGSPTGSSADLPKDPAERAAYIKAATGTVGVVAYQVGTVDKLRAASSPGDKIDVHHAPQAKPAGQVIANYDPAKAPGIALPQQEHKAIPTQKGTYTGTARDLVAKDVRDLRKHTNAPNSALHKLVKVVKETFPEAMKKIFF